MQYILYVIIFFLLFIIFVAIMAVALVAGAVAGIFIAYFKAAKTYVSSILQEINSRGARVFMTAVSVTAVVLAALFFIFCIAMLVVTLLAKWGLI